MLGASKAVASTIAVQTYGVFITPSPIFKFSPPGQANTPLATANVTGGVGPLEYSWVRLSGDTEITANNPAGVSTTFTANGSFGEQFTATFEVTVTDTGNGNLETTDTVFVSIIFEGT